MTSEADKFWCASGSQQFNSCSAEDVNLPDDNITVCKPQIRGPCRLKQHADGTPIKWGESCDELCKTYALTGDSSVCGYCREKDDNTNVQCICAGLPKITTSANCEGPKTHLSKPCDHIISTGTHVACNAAISNDRCWVKVNIGTDCKQVCAQNNGGEACGYCGGDSGSGACICSGKGYSPSPIPPPGPTPPTPSPRPGPPPSKKPNDNPPPQSSPWMIAAQSASWLIVLAVVTGAIATSMRRTKRDIP